MRFWAKNGQFWVGARWAGTTLRQSSPRSRPALNYPLNFPVLFSVIWEMLFVLPLSKLSPEMKYLVVWTLSAHLREASHEHIFSLSYARLGVGDVNVALTCNALKDTNALTRDVKMHG